MVVIERVLDRRVPSNFDHVNKYPARALRMFQRTVSNVEKRLTMPNRYVDIYDQGNEGACVGFGSSIMMSVLNRKLYDAWWLYREAQMIDEWFDTPPEEGTSLSAAFDVLRARGHRRLWGGASRPPELDEGIVEVNRWLTSVDEVRTALSEGKPVLFGIYWYYQFYRPDFKSSGYRGKREAWIAPLDDNKWGGIAGGHCICNLAASDRRQALGFANSWGRGYGVDGFVWMPYTSVDKLLKRQGEAAIVTDR